MKKVRYLIIGGGVAGTTAAEFIRMNDTNGSITIVMEEPERLYSRVMLPHYLRDQIPFERLYVRKPEQYEEKNIELMKGKIVSNINTQKKEIGLGGDEKIAYENLLIASGGKVNKLDISGSDLRGITYLRTIQDVQEVKNLMKTAKRGVVVGGGFIGIEYAQSFVKAGIKTTCIIREPFFWSYVVGDQMGRLINNILEKNGVTIINNSEAQEFVGEESLESVKLDNGQQVSAEIAGVGIGIHMELSHLKDSGIKVNKGVVTNEYLETETKDVWAAGDIAEFRDALFDKHHQMGNWSNAAAQGKVVGSNMAAGFGSKERESFVTVSAYTISIFDGSFTFMGDPAVDDDTEIVYRGSVNEGKLGRIHLKNDAVTGAALVNLPADRRHVERLIKEKVKITQNKEKLADLAFSLENF